MVGGGGGGYFFKGTFVPYFWGLIGGQAQETVGKKVRIPSVHIRMMPTAENTTQVESQPTLLFEASCVRVTHLAGHLEALPQQPRQLRQALHRQVRPAIGAAFHVPPPRVHEHRRDARGLAEGHVIGRGIADHQQVEVRRHAPLLRDGRERAGVWLGRHFLVVAADSRLEGREPRWQPQGVVEALHGPHAVSRNERHGHAMKLKPRRELLHPTLQDERPSALLLHLFNHGICGVGFRRRHLCDARQQVIGQGHTASLVHLFEVEVRHREGAIHVKDGTAQTRANR